MEMEMEVVEVAGIKDELGLALERLTAAAGALEQATERFAGIELHASQERGSAREAQLKEQLATAQATIASLRAEAGRSRRIAPGIATLTAKHGAETGTGAGADSGALDAALRSLSVEQRIAVKSEMMRAGLL